MSHIYRVKTEIKNIDPQIMRRAVDILSKILNVKYTIGGEITDYNGNVMKLGNEWAVFHKRLYAGKNFALNLETGEIRGDFYGEELLQTLKELIPQTYAGAVALQSVQNVWGGRLDEVTKRGDDIYILVEV